MAPDLHSAQTVPENFPMASILIVNYNAGRFLQKALDSIAAQTDRNYEVVLVDNASTDGSLVGLQTDHLSAFRLIALDTNTGFAAANNLAAQAAKGDWLALLNPDAEAFPDWLAEFKKAATLYPDTVMFAGATFSTENPDILDGAGDCYYGLGIPWRGGYGRPRAELPGIGECFSACGASAFIKRETFLQIGGFDERFFCYCEDVDIGFRLRLEGHRCLFWPGAQALHFGSGTTHVASDFSVRHGTRNRLWTFVKNMPPLGLIFGLPLHLALSLALLLRATMTGRGQATLLGLKDGLFGLTPVLADRRLVQRRRKLSTWQIIRSMSWNWGRLRNRQPDVKPLTERQTTRSSSSES